MFDFFKKKTGSRLGLDIGTSSLKAVQLERQETGWRLTNYALLDLFLAASGGALAVCEPSDSFSEERLVHLLKGFLKKGGFSAREVVVSVPVFSSFFTALTLPVMPEAELEGAIRYEARKYVPLPLEEVELDWVIASQFRETAVAPASKKQKKKIAAYGNLDILLAAVPKDLISRLTKIVSALGLKLVALEAESFSLVRALHFQAELVLRQIAKRQALTKPASSKSYLILDTGARSTSLIWSQKNNIRLVHFIDFSGNRVSNLLGEKYHLGLSQIEVGKRSPGFLPAKDVKPNANFIVGQEETAHLRPVFEKVVSEIRAVIVASQNLTASQQTKFVEPQFCLVSGGAVHLWGFLAYLSANLDMPVIPADPLVGLETSVQSAVPLKELSPLLTVAVGLALR